MAKKNDGPKGTLIIKYKGPTGQVQPFASKAEHLLKSMLIGSFIRVMYNADEGTANIYINPQLFENLRKNIGNDKFIKTSSVAEIFNFFTQPGNPAILESLLQQEKTSHAATLAEYVAVQEQLESILEKSVSPDMQKTEPVPPAPVVNGLLNIEREKGFIEVMKHNPAYFNRHQNQVIDAAFDLYSRLISQRKPYSGAYNEAVAILEAKKETLLLNSGKTYESYPEDAKRSIQKSWSDAEAIVREHEEYFVEANKIPLLCQIKHSVDCTYVSVSVRKDATDELSSIVKKAFENYRTSLYPENPNKVQYLDSIYVGLMLKDKPKSERVLGLLKHQLSLVTQKANLEIILLKGNSLYDKQIQGSQENKAPITQVAQSADLYSNCGTWEGLWKLIASERGYNGITLFEKSDNRLGGLYQNIMRSKKKELEGGRLRVQRRTLDKYSELLGIPVEVFLMYVDVLKKTK